MRYELALRAQGFGRRLMEMLGYKAGAAFAHTPKRSVLTATITKIFSLCRHSERSEESSAFSIKKHFLLPTSYFLLFLLLPLNVFAADDFFFKANELYDQGRYKESVKYYRAAIDDGRYEPFAWFNLGNALVQLGKKEVAMVAYKRTVYKCYYEEKNNSLSILFTQYFRFI